MRSKSRWDSLLPDWGQIIAIEDWSVCSDPLSMFQKLAPEVDSGAFCIERGFEC